MICIHLHNKQFYEKELENFVIGGQNNADTVRFVLPKLYKDEIDLTSYSWAITFENRLGKGDTINLQIKENADSDLFYLDWKPSSLATQVSGKLMVQIFGFKADSRFTLKAFPIYVSENLSPEPITQALPSIIDDALLEMHKFNENIQKAIQAEEKAENYSNSAKDWATSEEKVEGDLDSAKTYALKAKQTSDNLAETADEKITTINISLDEANNAANKSKASELAAKASQEAAAISESNSNDSATAASQAAIDAANSASGALASKNASKVSEDNAKASQEAAALSASNAAESEANSNASKEAATESETNAAQYAQDAEASATAAATSATSAAQSKTEAEELANSINPENYYQKGQKRPASDFNFEFPVGSIYMYAGHPDAVPPPAEGEVDNRTAKQIAAWEEQEFLSIPLNFYARIFELPEDVEWKSVEGRVLVGAGEVEDESGNKGTFVLKGRGGEIIHQLSTDEMPEHTHGKGSFRIQGAIGSNRLGYVGDNFSQSGALYNSADKPTGAKYDTGSKAMTISIDTDRGGLTWDIGNSGSGVSHNNLQPYETIMIFKRVN